MIYWVVQCKLTDVSFRLSPLLLFFFCLFPSNPHIDEGMEHVHVNIISLVILV